jgi:hypothetical protein
MNRVLKDNLFYFLRLQVIDSAPVVRWQKWKKKMAVFLYHFVQNWE